MQKSPWVIFLDNSEAFSGRKKRSATISINFSALQHNFQQVKKLATGSKIMPVIKANAYGHGLLQAADCLTDADGFAVAQLDEAIALREHGIEKPITVFQGFLNAEQLDLIFKFNLCPAISQQWQLDLLEQIDSETLIDVWLKINTGMGRLGFQLADVNKSFNRLKMNSKVNQLGLMMHFANADEPAHISNQTQSDEFLKTVADCKRHNQGLEMITSAANSAAILANLLPVSNESPGQDWLRPGIMLYGSSPFADKTAADLELKPVMSLQATLIAINQLKKMQSVGYGNAWICPENMPVGIVNIGYGDGYPRHAVDAPIAVNGQRCRIIGRVSMDSIAVDLRDIKCRCGDPVECWGEQISVDEVAASAQTIAYELLCNVGRC